MDVPHKVEYKIRDLTTHSITLFPDQAQVHRNIKDVPLKPGVNEITIIGLSPTVNQQSIKVEGSGVATISGITTEYIANQERFEDVYPDSDSESSDDDDDDSDIEESPEPPSFLEVKTRLVEIGDELVRAQEVIANADERIKILDSYCNSLNKRESVDISAILATYKQEREIAQGDRMAARIRERQMTEARAIAHKEQVRLVKLQKKLKAKAKKSQAKVQKIKNKKKQQRERRKEQVAKEKARIRWERMSVWPKNVYTVTIQLEVNAAFTPGPSRRGSVSSEVDIPVRSSTGTMDIDETFSCDLVLTYVTGYAYWTPSYDLQLSTPTNTGSLCFDACLNNTTSETWENCKITLSTSQTSIAGPNDSVPFLRPWKIKMTSKGSNSKSSGITNSAREMEERAMIREKKRSATPLSRGLMFGDPSGFPLPPGAPGAPPQQFAGQSKHALQDYQMQLMLLEQQNKKRLKMARQEQDSLLPTAHMPPPPPPNLVQQGGMQMPQALNQQQIQMQVQRQAVQQQQQQQQQWQQQQQLQQQQLQHMQAQAQAHRQAQAMPQQQQQQMLPPPHFPPPMQVNMAFGMDQAPGSASPPPQMPLDFDLSEFMAWTPDTQPALDFQESLVEETGLTTTYDLPGHKTLASKFTATKQRVARVNFHHVSFSHIVVAKYHAAAYLKASLKNNSKWALLKGPGSLTLDGSFMGKVSIPRCSAGDGFTLNLGVDPAIKVLYPKAEVKRSTTGMFNKEDSSGFVRCIKLHNTRASSGKPVNVYVFDQIPMSEDERLRVDLVSPRGLILDGPRIPSGVPGRDTPAQRDWGKAGVILKKDGQLSWDVSLNPGKMVKLDLEYTVSTPVGEGVEECSK